MRARTSPTATAVAQTFPPSREARFGETRPPTLFELRRDHAEALAKAGRSLGGGGRSANALAAEIDQFLAREVTTHFTAIPSLDPQPSTSGRLYADDDPQRGRFDRCSIDAAADGSRVTARWTRWAVVGAPSGTLIDPALTSEVTWTLDGATLTRDERLTASQPINIRRWWVVMPSP